ncbi:MAG: anaerobic ribonucleoside-triphosphate reductase activating protein [Clostridia bacterium]|nr:anaerobic ribonucleoside-triphosphate reductase activating protein [Clostridia bacterium]
MNICGLQKLTLLDFPEHTACTVFTGGCNLRCPFCHNASLVKGRAPTMDKEELWSFFKKRAGLLDGVCISGGEPLLQPNIGEFIKELRQIGYKIKLDTNGTYPNILCALLEEGLIDYVAVDLKNSPELYGKTVGIEGFDFEVIAKTMEILRAGKVPYEYRTTVVKPLHSLENLEALGKLIAPDEPWFLQQFTDSGDILGEGLLPFSPDEMRTFAEKLKENNPSVSLRGL